MNRQENRAAGLVLFRAEGAVGRLILNAPPQNVMTGGFFRAFDAALDDVAGSGCKALVIHGAGRHFSSGAHIDELLASVSAWDQDGTAPEKMGRNSRIFRRLRDLAIPVVAAIRGVCLGSGFELALWAHVRVCGPRAVMGLPETDFALMPGCGGTFLLPAIVGRAGAMALILTGRRFGAQEAKELGLVDLIAERGRVIETGIAVAARIAGVGGGADCPESGVGRRVAGRPYRGLVEGEA